MSKDFNWMEMVFSVLANLENVRLKNKNMYAGGTRVVSNARKVARKKQNPVDHAFVNAFVNAS